MAEPWGPSLNFVFGFPRPSDCDSLIQPSQFASSLLQCTLFFFCQCSPIPRGLRAPRSSHLSNRTGPLQIAIAHESRTLLRYDRLPTPAVLLHALSSARRSGFLTAHALCLVRCFLFRVYLDRDTPRPHARIMNTECTMPLMSITCMYYQGQSFRGGRGLSSHNPTSLHLAKPRRDLATLYPSKL